MSLLILGNGFDLHCGLETTYSHFFEVQSKTEGYQKAIAFIDKAKQDQRSGTPIDFGHARSLFSPSFSLWDLFFLVVRDAFSTEVFQKRVVKWSDIEEIMSISFSNFDDEEKVPRWSECPSLISDLRDQSDDNKTILGGSLTGKVFLALALLCDSSFFDAFSKTEDQESYFYSFLMDQLHVFEQNFSLFVQEQLKIHDDYQRRATAFVQQLIYPEVYPSIESFNYTAIFKQDDLVNIHGRVSGPDFPIFGIDDKRKRMIWGEEGLQEQIDNLLPREERYAFTKAARRLEVLQWGGSQRNPGTKIKNVIVYGHSLNQQDFPYFFQLFDAMGLSDPSEKSTISFPFSVFDKAREKDILAENRKAIINLLYSYSKERGLDEDLLARLETSGRLMIQAVS